MGFGDFSFSLQMRDTVERIAGEVVNRIRPSYRYAIVDSVDTGARVAEVTLIGESASVIVNLGSQIPIVGQRVRVEGMSGDRFIADVVGQPLGGEYVIRDDTKVAGSLPNTYENGITITVGESGDGWPFTNCTVTTNKTANNRIVQRCANISGGERIRTGNDATTWNAWQIVTPVAMTNASVFDTGQAAGATCPNGSVTSFIDTDRTIPTTGFHMLNASFDARCTSNAAAYFEIVVGGTLWRSRRFHSQGVNGQFPIEMLAFGTITSGTVNFKVRANVDSGGASFTTSEGQLRCERWSVG